jgi:FMN-dependent NADH-azoreductase
MQHPGMEMTKRDLVAQPLPHIDENYVVGRMLPADKRTAEQATAVGVCDVLLRELSAANFVVIASAMINFGISSQLKSWFDYVIRPGVTFSSSPTGPVGLLCDKKVYLILARGGIYADGPRAASDFQEPYLRKLLTLMGLTDLECIRIEGIAGGAEAAEKSYTRALEEIALWFPLPRHRASSVAT